MNGGVLSIQSKQLIEKLNSTISTAKVISFVFYKFWVYLIEGAGFSWRDFIFHLILHWNEVMAKNRFFFSPDKIESFCLLSSLSPSVYKIYSNRVCECVCIRHLWTKFVSFLRANCDLLNDWKKKLFVSLKKQMNKQNLMMFSFTCPWEQY